LIAGAIVALVIGGDEADPGSSAGTGDGGEQRVEVIR
jgi:hypothetical protein